MKNKGKLIATSFIAGAAAALYASKQMHIHTSPSSTAKNNSRNFSSEAAIQTPNNNPTTAETNNFYTKAPSLATDYSSTGVTSEEQIPYNVYFENIQTSKPSADGIANDFSNVNENNFNTVTSIKIDSW